MEGVFALLKRRERLVFIYLSTLFLSFHYFLTVYINSSLLSEYLSSESTSLLYIVGSLINVLALIFIVPLLRNIGGVWLIIILSILEILAVLSLSSFDSLVFIIGAFVIHQALPPLILFVLDIFLEETPHRNSSTGSMRGLFLTVSNVALITSPLIVGFFIIDNNFSNVYVLSALFMVPIILITYLTKSRFDHSKFKPLQIKKTSETFLKNLDLRNVLLSNFLLQLFYAWMVIYTPLHLRDLGFSWQDISIIFTFMLLPFIILEYPVGRLSDKRLGEKEFMVGGFILLSLSTALISFIVEPSLIIWSILLFITRVGASFVEISTETYFFKKISGEDTPLISFFRITRPLSFVIGPMIGALTLSLFGLSSSFIVFGALMFIGVFLSLQIRDTL